MGLFVDNVRYCDVQSIIVGLQSKLIPLDNMSLALSSNLLSSQIKLLKSCVDQIFWTELAKSCN